MNGAVETPLAGCVELSLVAGGTLPRSAARVAVLPLAPGRWLLVEADAAAIAAAVAAGAVATDVDGKWRCFALRGPQATAILSAAVNLDLLLDGRDAAVTSVFDCPGVIARAADGGGFDVYVHASYAHSLAGALDRARRHAEPA